MKAPITRPVLNSDLISQIWRSWVDYIDKTIAPISTPSAGAQANTIIDGGCMVAQDGATFNVSNTPQYGQVDLILCSAGGTVSAGTITQASNANYKSGKCCKIAGLTVTGSGAVIFKHRVPSRNVAQYINSSGVFSCKVKHDGGSNIDYAITINKANASDNFSAVTQVATSVAATSVTDSTETQISLAVADFGACGNGIEIVVTGSCGAVTTKNFEISEMKFEPGTTFTAFIPDLFNRALDDVEMFRERSYAYGVATGATTFDGFINESATRNAAASTPGVRFSKEKYKTPSVTIYSPATGSSGYINNAGDKVASASTISTKGFGGVDITSGSTASAANYHFDADSRL